MPTISVIVPVYKVEPYIHRCVDSILGQSYSDFELILVDDGSPDNCGAICDEYAGQDSRIHVIHQKNGGLSSARNAGIEWLLANSDSEWLTFVDSDDWLHTQFLETLYNIAIIHNCIISAGGLYITSGKSLPDYLENASQCLSANDYYCSEIYGGFQATACGKLYHRSLFQDLRYPVGKLHEDEFTTYLAIYAAEKIAVTEAPVYAYYQNSAGIMRSTWNPRRLHGLEALQGQIAFAQSENNERLFVRATDGYVWNLTNQILQISDSISRNGENVVYQKRLRNELRIILKNGFYGRRYPINRRNLELYEVAYPATALWKFVHGVYGRIKKILK